MRRALGFICASVALAAPLAAGAQVTAPHPGITLSRKSQQALAIVNLCAPGVSVRATRAGERVKTASQWGQQVGAQLAVNGDFYDIGGSNATWGRARGAGEDWPSNLQFQQGPAGEHRLYLAFGPEYSALVYDSFIEPPPPNVATDIVGGHILIITNGQKVEPIGDILAEGLTPRPRTAVGLSQDKRTFFLFTSLAGLTGNGIVANMTELAAAAGAPPIWEAVNLDGGGSTQMYVAGLGAILPSSRQVSNHWGIYASGSGPAVSCPRVPFKATFVSQSYPYASAGEVQLAVGETTTGFIEMRNDGAEAWKPGVVHLAPTPRDVASPFHADDWASPTRISTVAQDVPPGASYKFPASLKGNVAGDVQAQFFGLVAEGITWFSEQGGPPDNVLEVRVRVTPAPVDPAASSAGAGAGASAGQGGGATSVGVGVGVGGGGAGGGLGPDAGGGGAAGANGSGLIEGQGCVCALAGGPRGGGAGAGWLTWGLALALALGRVRARAGSRSRARRAAHCHD